MRRSPQPSAGNRSMNQAVAAGSFRSPSIQMTCVTSSLAETCSAPPSPLTEATHGHPAKAFPAMRWALQPSGLDDKAKSGSDLVQDHCVASMAAAPGRNVATACPPPPPVVTPPLSRPSFSILRIPNAFLPSVAPRATGHSVTFSVVFGKAWTMAPPGGVWGR